MQVATQPTASEFRGGIISVTLRPVSGANFVSPITDEHLLHGLVRFVFKTPQRLAPFRLGSAQR